MHEKTLAGLSQALHSKAISSVELTEHYLKRIEQFDGALNSYITVTPELALEQARVADARLAAGDAGPLTGIPLAHKDLFCTQGIRTSCGSKMLDNFIAPYESTVTARLLAAGTVTLGKTNMDEFAMGSSNESSYYGAVRNPWNTEHVPGGSSGGSAAAVAARLCAAATGTDTGGSIRQPAGYTALTGLKPTYGRISRWGMIAYASSLDQAGPMARTAEDCALLLQAMAGFDERDSTSVDEPVPDYSAELNQPLSGLRIGLPKEYFASGLDTATADAIAAAVKQFQALGAEIKDISLPNAELAIPAYYIIAPAEASSNLSRFDGVRFGYRCENPADLTDLYKRSRAEGFGDEVKRRIMVGAYALSAGYYDAYYLQAQKVRRLIKNDFMAAYEQVDVILCPTSPTPAFRIGEKIDDPVSLYLTDIYTITANLAGVPGIALPAGFAGDLPIGMQLLGPYFSEARLLNVAHQYQQHTDWHTRAPAGI
ncbi:MULTISPECIES: Asp-tRNA(Asn)/Glu-tRNA(Gln) amidotransferase subunit GatA [Halopseudomonas]|uniref:Glutamyl-tRNA(Gln) amidotransferase subunit A n=1 Tax=Halopseudomonas bauzanensis TaxID=653930 RepID=A0A031M5Y8_9GAMM|nr:MULTISPECIES: Asp-tRNA(Asn)/Glu-tRNA(Gln) amidotransferase subunit GatA [Halopseudomonas]EZQ16017.1 glutamyl-tRNA amidotransferase [Halopseudomonas bauzanensis]WGK62144.1 Asp-tRNA(Asn)/Glu-tRNA(Gln) amidotransferase subunit GatA [Halopseudomonas sp. SMJS2]SES36669.1 aspartyl/glutamyl-tRNA(Asn/Gln) amidotransferase subunit A [Halopseudomonas bauzanensis]SFM38556.1 aspartyl/glutamyl-tRNA(Asn/Gln) amidotransferase subunit A [Halopseudomonas bauzanensis]